MTLSTLSSPPNHVNLGIQPISPTKVPVSPEVSASPHETLSRHSSPDDSDRGRSTRPKRHPFLTRKVSSTVIIPRTQPKVNETEEYLSDDARAMSPPRDSAETERMETAARLAIRTCIAFQITPINDSILTTYRQAREVQLNFLNIAESIELVKADHNKLESQNLALQDYISGLISRSFLR